MIKAIIFDLYDTLFLEQDYVKSGFYAIERELKKCGLGEFLFSLFQEDINNVYQRYGFSEKDCEKCVGIYRKHFPNISLSFGVKQLLDELKINGFQLGIITDGRPQGQWNKINALDLEKWMDCIIVTDELGGIEYRKPHPKSFEIAQQTLGVEFDEMMYIGDNPEKDFFIKSIYPITVVQLKQGMKKNNSFFKNVYPDYQIADLGDLKNLLWK